ncbi:MAG TPA: ATP-binding protein, partial [Polyangiaceae bacterium]
MELRSSIPRGLGLRAGVIAAACAVLACGLASRFDVLSHLAVIGAFSLVGALSLAARAKRKRELAIASSSPSPTAKLADDLCDAASLPEIIAAIEDAVRACVRCAKVELSVDAKLWIDGGQGFASGTHRIVSTGRWHAQNISVDLAFRGEKLGTLSACREAPAFTARDVELLATIGKQGSLALAHTATHCELERRREQQAAAWQDEREAVVETLSAEIVHEVRYPINFFRSIFQRASETRILDDEDIEIGCEEVERLERLVFDLRRLTGRKLDRRMVDIGEICTRAQALLRDRMSSCRLSVDLSGGGAIECDPDKVTQVLVNLLANAVEATQGRGEIGIEWRANERGGVLEVWDSGPGFNGDPSKLFTPGHTTKSRGTGLGLTISARLVRAHGWSIEASRSAARTVFSVSVPED